jgi:SNF2 family DNA or RNA helicase
LKFDLNFGIKLKQLILLLYSNLFLSNILLINMDDYLNNLPVFEEDINNESEQTIDLIDTDYNEDQIKLETIDLNETDYIDNKKINNIDNISYILLSKKDLYKRGVSKLNKFQLDILKECAQKKYGGLSLPMGSGKTLISLVLSLGLTKKKGIGPILIIMAKSLIHSWENEIFKFFSGHVKYEILHNTIKGNNINTWTLNSDTTFVLTTPDVLAKVYKECNLSEHVKQREFVHNYRQFFKTSYYNPTEPLLKNRIGVPHIYTINWGCVIIDEAQIYTNIETLKCQALIAIYAKYRWALSGTLFDEPKPQRILGYYKLIGENKGPRDVPSMNFFMHHWNFKGLEESLVKRTSNEAFIPPKINRNIITHTLTPEEEKIYTCMRDVLIKVRDRAKEAQIMKNNDELRRFSSYKMVMLMYLRQCLICPILPLASIAVDVLDFEKRSDLSKLIINQIKQLNLETWLNDIESAKSTRIKEVLNALDKHKHEQVVLFSCYTSAIDLLEVYIGNTRPIFRLEAKHSIIKRGEIIENFKQSINGILVGTYQLCAVGLNLQFARVIMLLDFWWNASKTQQAIARIFRYGQTASEIFTYMFVANTGVERAVLKKQDSKLKILEELQTGRVKTKIQKIKIDDIIRMIELNINKDMVHSIYI